MPAFFWKFITLKSNSLYKRRREVRRVITCRHLLPKHAACCTRGLPGPAALLSAPKPDPDSPTPSYHVSHHLPPRQHCPATLLAAEPPGAEFSCLAAITTNFTYADFIAAGGERPESQDQQGWKGPLRSPSRTINPTPPCLLNHVPKCHIHTVFEPLQGWGLHHCPWQPGPVSDKSFSEDIFPSIDREDCKKCETTTKRP